MLRWRKLLTAVMGLLLSLVLSLQSGISAFAGGDDCLEALRGGVAAVLKPGSSDSTDTVYATAQMLNYDLNEVKEEEQESKLVMANVKSALNVRSDASTEAEKVGMLYKDCGGTILERRDGWTKLQSGNIITGRQTSTCSLVRTPLHWQIMWARWLQPLTQKLFV